MDSRDQNRYARDPRQYRRHLQEGDAGEAEVKAEIAAALPKTAEKTSAVKAKKQRG